MTAAYGPSALLTPANLVTVTRIAVSPVAFTLMLADESSWLLFAVWFALSASDGLDGYVARRHGATRSGAFLDPLADKVLVLGGFACLAAVGRFPWLVFGLTAVREAAISGFRSWYARRGLAVPASKLAKLKTFVQLATIGLAVWPLTDDQDLLIDVAMWASVAVAWVSGAQYFLAGSRATTTMQDTPTP